MNKGKPWREVLAEQLDDPGFRRDWSRTAAARAVANWLCGYRAEQGLTQEELARRVGMKQSAIARLELGETEPKLSTLVSLVAALNLPLQISLIPGESEIPGEPAIRVVSPATNAPDVQLLASAG